MIVLYHHLGLGDHFICNSIVRYYANDNDFVYLICKKRNVETVSFMYRDLANIQLVLVDDDIGANNYIKNCSMSVKRIGFSNLGTESFDETFYMMAGIDFDSKWNDFYVLRDGEEENKIVDYFNIKNKEYIFVHDDSTRGYRIKEKYIDNKVVVRPELGLTGNICNYMLLIEKAKEIHCIDSSFRCMIDCFLPNKNNKHFHYYSRMAPKWNTPKGKNWIQYNE